MDQQLLDELKKIIKGDILYDEKTLNDYSHCASIFEVKPKVVIFPKDTSDLESLVTFVTAHKSNHPELAITARSAGTDMTGGSVGESIIVSFEKYFNMTPTVQGELAKTQPGVYYRDFEKETMKNNLIFPSYPASRDLCAMGGIVNNNSGGEKSLQYGKTERYVKKIKAILSDGKEHELHSLNNNELQEKMKQEDFVGQLYRKIFNLIETNYDLLQKAKPNVSKNSAGYFLWNVYDKEKQIFDLSKLFVGAQGTLGLMTEAEIQLVPIKKHAEMMIIFMHDLNHLAEIINIVLPLQPDTFEAYDDNTLKLALKFFPEFAKFLGTKGIIQTGLQFLPEFMMSLTGGLPKLILQIDFQSDSRDELDQKIEQLKQKLAPLHPQTRIAHTEKEELKYWLIRRQSFNLLRQKVKDLHTAPFIDDFAVRPELLPEFLPQLNTIFSKYPSLIYTIAGHVGDGNFHIIPLMKIEDPTQREIIPVLGKEVYDLVLKYNGTITAEHNDGIIRTPYLKQMYGEEVYRLFEETKKIFDPDNIFNPGKKVGGTLEYAMNHIRLHW